MRLSPIVLLLRNAETSFGNEIAGAAEFGMVQNDTLEVNTAYVLQTDEITFPNTTEGDVSQKLIEEFGITVAIRNDLSQMDKTGLTAYDSLFEIRKEFWNPLVGLWLTGLDDDQYQVLGPIAYKGGVLLDINPAWLWYQFQFTFPARLTGAEKEYDLDDFETLSAQWVITPNAQIPLTGADPLPDALGTSDMESIISFTENLLGGSFDSRAFSSGFDLYEG